MARGLQVGDVVAWHHTLAATAESVRRETLPKAHFAGLEGEDQPETPVGTITSVANDEGTYFEVEFEAGDKKVLTNEELIKIVEGEVPRQPTLAEEELADMRERILSGEFGNFREEGK